MREFLRVVEDYMADLWKIRVSGGATGERSGYGPLAIPLNDIDGRLRLEVFYVSELADQGTAEAGQDEGPVQDLPCTRCGGVRMGIARFLRKPSGAVRRVPATIGLVPIIC